MELSYDDFRHSMPMAETTPSYLKNKLGPSDKQNSFVAPRIQVLHHDDNARVALISAPAAVGKSFLARQLSADNQALMWDLAHFSLGSNFFVGTAVSAYGPEGYPVFLKEITSGKRLLVLDAADEALVRAGRENYVAAIENLADMVKDAATLSVVILGRDDTIEDTAAVLEACNVVASRYAVAYFDEPHAIEFVRYKAEQQGGPVIKEFTSFMTTFFDAVASALGVGSFEEARSFLGYAPVLDALAAYYSDKVNPLKVLEAVKRAQNRQYVWELLHNIMETVLTREQKKFAKNFSGSTEGRKWQFGFEAFPIQAQLTYLLDPARVHDAVAFAEEGEDSWYAELESQLEAQLREHPFLTANVGDRDPNPLLNFASAAFRDYVIARAFADHTLLHRSLLESYWRSPELNPTPILAGLVFAGLFDHKNSLPAAAFGILHDSHASENDDRFAPFLVSTAEPNAVDNGGTPSTLTLYRFEGRTQGSIALTVALEGRSPTLFRRTSLSLIDLPGLGLRAGDGFADFLLGPSVFIYSDSFDSFVSDIRVRQGDRPGGVSMHVSRVMGSTKRLDCIPEEALRITGNAEPLPHPWFRYTAQVTPGPMTTGALNALAMEVRRMVMWFTKPSMFGGGLRYPIGATEALVAKRRISGDFFDFVTDSNMLKRVGDEYVLTVPAMTATIVRNDLSDTSYRSFLESFAAWKRDKAS